MKFSNDNQYRVQCAFESQQHVTCNCLVQSEARSLAFDGKFLNPIDLSLVQKAVSTLLYGNGTTKQV